MRTEDHAKLPMDKSLGRVLILSSSAPRAPACSSLHSDAAKPSPIAAQPPRSGEFTS